MSTLKVLKEKEMTTFENMNKLRNIHFDKKCKREHSIKLREIQDEQYNKNKFYKGLLRHWKGTENGETKNIRKNR